MTTHATPPETAGPQIPIQVPPLPATGPVFLSKPPAGALPPGAEAGTPTLLQRHADRTRQGGRRLLKQGRDWAWAENLDEEKLEREILRERANAARKARREHANYVRELQKQVRESATQHRGHRADNLQQALAALQASGPAHMVEDEVTDRDLSRAHYKMRATRCAIVAAGAYGGLMVDVQHPILFLAEFTAMVAAAWHFGREQSETEGETADASASGAPVGPAEPVAYTATPQVPAFDAPPPPALSKDVLTGALRDSNIIKPNAEIEVLAAPAWGKDGTATVVFDLPSGGKVKDAQDKLDALAGALGRDVTMIDVTKAGTGRRCSLWMSDEDPFERPRPSPLLMLKGGIDAWKDGIPVAWAKRGTPIYLPVRDSNYVIGGMTRSGKGVGAANLTAGATLDARINLRIVPGKNNGEWDAYAKAGVASTYFKPNADRLLALLKALLADKNRREQVLGKLSKSKLVPEAIGTVGGIELLIIDELATYTRPGKPLREEILEALIELSAVAAGAGILMVLITQYPEADVIPQALAMNCGTRWAMRVDNATQSNAILGGGSAGSGRDASKFDPPRPGLGWLVNPFAGITDLARSFDLDEDERGEVTKILARAADLRKAAGRLNGQWDDPIERHLVSATGLSSAGGGPAANGVPGKARALTEQEKAERDVLAAALRVMDELGRDAQLEEMASRIGDGMTPDRLGELLRSAGAGGTVKITVPGRTGRVNGYQRADVRGALALLQGT
jgi:hypothetical protein